MRIRRHESIVRIAFIFEYCYAYSGTLCLFNIYEYVMV